MWPPRETDSQGAGQRVGVGLWKAEPGWGSRLQVGSELRGSICLGCRAGVLGGQSGTVAAPLSSLLEPQEQVTG